MMQCTKAEWIVSATVSVPNLVAPSDVASAIGSLIDQPKRRDWGGFRKGRFWMGNAKSGHRQRGRKVNRY